MPVCDWKDGKERVREERGGNGGNGVWWDGEISFGKGN
jgi:hypothetical protein